MSAPLRIAVLGAGSMGANHARVVAEHPDTELVAVVDTDPTRGRELAAAHASGYFESLAAVGSTDAVIVAVPTEIHHDVALPLLAAGSPVLVEKPLAAEPSQVAELIRVAREAQVPLMCGFVERFNPAVATAMSLLEEPPLYVGAVRHSPAAERIRTSVVHDLLIHDIDLALRLVGQPLESEPVARGWIAPRGVTEQADVLLGFVGGSTANISASRLSQRKVRTINVATGASLLEIDLLRHDLTVYRHRSESQLDQGGPTYRAETVVDIPFVRHEGEPLALQLGHFVALVRGEADAAAELATLERPHEVAAKVDSMTHSGT